MTVIARVGDLLDIADDLARRDTGRPKPASLGRAVSTAYYAVFHQLAYLCADELVDWRKPWHFVRPIYRALDHAAARRFFERARTDRVFVELGDVGRVFITLQEQRHRADYDPEPFLTRKATLELIAQARQAVLGLDGLPVDMKRLLAASLVGARQR